MKIATIAILICAFLLAAVMLVFDRNRNVEYDGWRIIVDWKQSSFPRYYDSGVFAEEAFPTSEEVSAFFNVWNSYEHESGWPFVRDYRNDAFLYYDGGDRFERFCYDSETGQLARYLSFPVKKLEFKKMKLHFYEDDITIESFTTVSGDDKEKLDAIVARYRNATHFRSSAIIVRTPFDADDSGREPGYVDLSRTYYAPDEDGTIPDIPEAVIEYLKGHHDWSAIDEVHLVRNWLKTSPKFHPVYSVNVRIRWDETHDRIYVIEYDEDADIIYSSEYEDMDPYNGVNSSPLYDEIYILPKLRKEADKIFPISDYYHESDCIELDYLPDDSCISHPPAGTTYAEFVENFSDDDFRIVMHLRQLSDNVEFDIEAVKTFMIEHLIDNLSVTTFDSYVYFSRAGDVVTVYN